MSEDPIVAEVRAIRAKMLEECGGDLGKLIARVHRNTKKLGLKTVSFVKQRPDSAQATVLTARRAAPAKTRKRKAV